MDTQLKPYLKQVLPILLIALAFQAIGLLYYLIVRDPELRPFQTALSFHYDATSLSFLGGILPSFVHAVGLFLVIACLNQIFPASRKTRLTAWASAIAVLLVIEFSMGTPKIADALAVVLAVPFALFILSLKRFSLHQLSPNQFSPNQFSPNQFSLSNHPISSTNRRKHSGMTAAALCAFALSGTASYPGGGDFSECARFDNEGRCIERAQTASPIYMSYNELRSSVRVSESRPMDDVGRIYVFGNRLYINERNRGIHVIDNSDPFNPQPLRFIEIPGNLDIEIRGSRLYADSFIDLVTLDISNPEATREVDRQTEVFAWDENQNIPYNIRLLNSEVDRNLGVVIAYEVIQ